MADAVKAVPEGLHTLTPHLVVKGGAEAIEFYQKALGAELVYKLADAGGRLLHADLKVGDSRFFLCDAFPDYGSHAPDGSKHSFHVHLYVENADAAVDRAVKAGATVLAPLQNMPWGDRYGTILDPFGHHWSIASHIEDVTPEQLQQRMAGALSGEPCS
jgi:uncharacterized glyoxalase superfamily protein PhnB